MDDFAIIRNILILSILIMHILNGTQNLPDNTSCSILRKLTVFSDKVENLSTAAKLRDKHESFCILKVMNCFGDTVMIEDFHDVYFGQKAQLSFVVHIRLAENFDGSELLACRLVFHVLERDCVAFPDFSKGALSEWFIDDPIMVSHSTLMFGLLQLNSCAKILPNFLGKSCFHLMEFSDI